MCGAKGHVRFAPNSDREVLHRPLIPAIHIGCSPIASTDPARLCVRSTTYTEIYRCISHGAEGSALVFGMWEKVRIETLAVTATVIWFAVVVLGFGSHVLPLFEIGP